MSAPGTIEFKRVLIAHRGEIAPRMVRAFRDAWAGDTGPLADRYLLHGDPDVIVARLGEYHAAGAETLIFCPACPPDRQADVTAPFAEGVRPRLPGASS